jgi:hypothetical protein
MKIFHSVVNMLDEDDEKKIDDNNSGSGEATNDGVTKDGISFRQTAWCYTGHQYGNGRRGSVSSLAAHFIFSFAPINDSVTLTEIG